MKKLFLSFIFLTLASVTQGMDAFEFLRQYKLFDSISVSPENMVLKINSHVREWNLEPNTELVITHENETVIGSRNVSLYFTPVIFKSQQKGLKICEKIYGGRDHGKKIIAYTTLSDEPMEMSEEDVEIIWKNGKMRPIEEYHAIVQREKEEKEANEKFLTRFFKAINDRYETEEERWAFFKELNAMESREAILAYLDELDNQNDPPIIVEQATPDLEMPTTLEQPNHIHLSEPQPPAAETATPASPAWLWWLALPVVAGVWFVVRLRKK